MRLRPSGWRLNGVLVLLAATLLWGAPIEAETKWQLEGLDGSTLSAADLSQGDTVFVVWAGWSPRCRDIDQKLVRLEQELGSRANLLTVNFQEKRAEVRSFVEEHAFSVPIFLDLEGTFAREHRVTALPGLVVYSGGKVTYQGKLPADPRTVLASALH